MIRAKQTAITQSLMQHQENIPAPLPTVSCGLAQVSMISGICSVLLGPLTGIPAIITGHIARSRIKKSGGMMQGQSMALTGLILGYIFSLLFVGVAALAAIGYTAAQAALDRASKTMAFSTAVNIEIAINQFVEEYASFPSDEEADVTVLTDESTPLIDSLLGRENRWNLKLVKFLVVKDASYNKNGLVFSSDDSKVLGLFDPWGNPYNVRMDLDFDDSIIVNQQSGQVIKNRRAAVWSNGPDQKSGTPDDIVSW